MHLTLRFTHQLLQRESRGAEEFSVSSLGHVDVTRYLVDDVDSVVQLLSLQDGVQVVEPVLQVLVSVAERDDDGDFLQRLAVFGFEASARPQVRVALRYLLQTDGGGELHPQGTH